jgi:hypothetical protein
VLFYQSKIYFLKKIKAGQGLFSFSNFAFFHLAQLLKAMNHYHSIQRGCKIIKRRFKTKKRSGESGFFSGAYCRTHKKELCHCGWEWQWHYGIFKKI